MKVFISYSHKQSEWVWQRLVPCLKAAGVEVLIDKDRFFIGETSVKQMDAIQDEADKQLLVLTEDYLRSKYCKHEMNRAIKKHPKSILPVIRQDCKNKLPNIFTKFDGLLYADLENDEDFEPWQALLKACAINDLGYTIPELLQVRDELVAHLENNNSVNLVGSWFNSRGLFNHLIYDYFENKNMVLVNLEDPDTITRIGLLTCISRAIGDNRPLRNTNDLNDLSDFKARLASRSMTHVVLTNFDLVSYRKGFDANFFSALRFIIMEEKKLTLLIQSRIPFENFIPPNLSWTNNMIATVKFGRL